MKNLIENYKKRWGINATVPENFFNSMSENDKSCSVLEIGCSSGYNLNFLYDQGFKNLFGIDRDSNAIELAISDYPEIKFSNIDVVSENLYDIFNKKFDIIFCKSTLQHIIPEKIDEVLDKINSSINEKGKLYLYETGFEDGNWYNNGESEHEGINLGSGVYSHKWMDILKRKFKSVENIEQNFYICQEKI